MRKPTVTLGFCYVLVCGCQHRAEGYGNRAPSIREAIRYCCGVGVSYEAGARVSSSLVGLSRTRHPEMLYLLKRTAVFGSGRTAAHPNLSFTFDIVLRGKNSPDSMRTAHYGYDTRTGVLGQDGDWCVVPAKFRSWLRNLYATTPRQHYVVRVIHGVKIVQAIPLPPIRKRPVARIRSQMGRWHGYDVFETGRLYDTLSILPNRGVACEAEYTVHPSGPGLPQGPQRMSISPRIPGHYWPRAYAGKTIIYRFRWKYDDGTYGPWSKVVSAKVLP